MGFFGGFFYCQPWFEDEGLGVFVGPEIPAELVEAGIPEIEDHGAIQAYKQNICPFSPCRRNRYADRLRIRMR